MNTGFPSHLSKVAGGALLLSLAACFGGGDDDDAPTPPPAGGARTLSEAACTSVGSRTYTNSPVFGASRWVAEGTEKAATTATTALPAHCVVQGTIAPRTGVGGVPYGIQFELRMPAAWNGRFFFQGGGGTDGSVSPATGIINSADGGNNVALSQGYAVVSTDGGHQNSTLATTAAFGADPQARIDWGYNAIDKTAVTAKSIIQGSYGAAPDKSYFLGCSNGGRQGMMFTQRFPDAFDGVVAGAPVMDLGSITAAEIWGLQQFAKAAPRDSTGGIVWSQSFSPADRQLFTDAYVKTCDATDGVADGMVQNPFACSFDPAVLQCTGAKNDTCWTPTQVAAVKATVAGPVTSSGGPVRVPSYSLPRETPVEGYVIDTGWMTPSGQPSRLIGTATSLPGDFAFGAVQVPYLHITPPDPTFDPLGINWDTYPNRMTIDPPWLSTRVDISAFKARGGKMIFYHGISDPGPSVSNTINYYNRLVQLNGGLTPTQAFARLFMVPAMTHCSGGPSTDSFDQLSAIVNWVEKGVAPEQIVAKARAANASGLTSVKPAIPADRTRPLCAYPKTAVYKSGDVEKAESFACQ
jgi:feruloyl esterase